MTPERMDALIVEALAPRDPRSMMPKSDRSIFLAGMREALRQADELLRAGDVDPWATINADIDRLGGTV
jgi:hypothetical protein